MKEQGISFSFKTEFNKEREKIVLMMEDLNFNLIYSDREHIYDTVMFSYPKFYDKYDIVDIFKPVYERYKDYIYDIRYFVICTESVINIY